MVMIVPVTVMGSVTVIIPAHAHEHCDASSSDGTWSVAACLPSRSAPRSCRLFRDGLFAAFDEPAAIERDRTRLPSQNASKSPSNLSQSDLRAENKCLSAERSKPGFAA